MRPFPVDAFEEPADAELGDDAAAEELRRQIENPVESAITPAHGWRELSHSDDYVLFGAGDPPEIVTLSLELEDEKWTWAGQGECTVHTWRRTAEAAEWDVDPDAPPSPRDRVLHLLLSERACTSGADPRPRLEEPQIEYGKDVVTISLFVRHIQAPRRVAFTCPGVPAVPIEVELEEPIGGRELLNGGIYPPQPPHVPF